MVDMEVLVKIYNLLPLTDCGECGSETCREFAEKLLLGEKDIHDCTPLGEENAEAIVLMLEDYYR